LGFCLDHRGTTPVEVTTPQRGEKKNFLIAKLPKSEAATPTSPPFHFHFCNPASWVLRRGLEEEQEPEKKPRRRGDSMRDYSA